MSKIEEKTALYEALLERARAKAVNDFHSYVQLMAPVILPEEFKDGAHIRLICDKLQDVESGKIKRLMLMLPPGGMKPLDKERTFVLMGDGSLMKLKYVRPGDFVIGKSGHPCRVSAIHEQGILPVLRLLTKQGREIFSARDHSFLTPLGWKEAGDLVVGESVAISLNQRTNLGGPRALEEFRLAGYFVGDGHVGRYGATQHCGITVFDPTLKVDLANCCATMGFGLSEKRKGYFSITNGARDWLRNTGIAGKVANTKEIPDFIWTGSDAEVAEFLAGYFETDGCVTQKIVKGGRERENFTCFFTTVSEKLAKGTQQLLTRLGINARVRHKRTNYKRKGETEYTKAWYVAFTDQDSCAKFFEKVPVRGPKYQRLLAHYPKRTKFEPPYEADKLVLIEESGSAECMCLTVEGDESFVANGIVVHNSVLVNKLFTSWCYGRHPQWQVITVSHSVDLAERFGRDVRDLLSSQEFQKIFPKTKLRPDVRAAGRWYTNKKGVYTAAGAGTSIAGTRANLGILDDLMSEQTAKSDLERERILKWYGPGFRTRLLPNARAIAVGTRWHQDDIQGHLLSQARKDPLADQWEVIKIPALLDEESADLLDLDEGESFWPQMWSRQDMLHTKANTSPGDWSALYMQEPTPEEGAIFKEGWFKRWSLDAPPECDFVFLSLDTAFSVKKSADFSVIQAWGIFFQTRTDDKGLELRVPNMILLGQKKGRYEYPELKKEVQESYKKFKPDAIVIEKAASGQSLLQDLQRTGLPLREFVPDRDKISRAHAVSPILSAGRVWLPHRTWADELKSSALQFPLAAHDDDVDAMVQAILYMRQGWMVGTEDEDHYWNQPPRRRRRASYWTPRRK